MKNLIFSLFIVLLLISCDSSDESSSDCLLDQTITYFSSNTINICNDMTHIPLQGTDSEYGKFINADSTLVIFYDNGALAGNYVQESDIKTIDNAVNHEFWYTTRDSSFIVTFPILSTDINWEYHSHNLISNNIDQKDLILDIARTLMVN